jgi:prephenate dehydrogenase
VTVRRSARADKAPVVAVVGLGLIGASLACDLTRAGYRVVGVDRASLRRRARALGYVAATRATLTAAWRDADVIVLAAPPRANLALLREAARALRSAPRAGVVLTDVSSVKQPIVRLAARLALRTFVGGHPLAGRERSGLAAAGPDLFRGRAWALTPTPRTDARALRAVRRIVRAVGARPVTLDAARHDRSVAILSHLPQLVAWALEAAARADGIDRRLAGRAFGEMTRLSRSPRGLWREILSANAREVRRARRAFEQALRRPPL